MKIIIIILQAILNLVRKRRDLIANRNNIPPEYRDDVVVWYSPKKQRLTNYDVIESYAEDFLSNKWGNTENVNATITSKSITYNRNVDDRNRILSTNKPCESFIIYATVSTYAWRYQYVDENGIVQFYDIKNGINVLPKSYNNKGVTIGFLWMGNNIKTSISITQLPTSILKDFSGNGLDAYMYGFQGKLNSGVGIYKVDFSKSQNINAFDNFERFNNKFIAKGNYNGNWNTFGEYDINGIVKNKVIIKITGLNNVKDKLVLEYGYFTTDSKYIKTITFIDKDGVYTYDLNDIVIPEGSNIARTVYNRMYFGESIINDVNLIVEEIPDYPNSLCYAGKQYCQAYNIPKFTDYTIITRRAILSLNGSFGLISKRIIPADTGAFILEKDNNVTGAEPNTLRAFTFMTPTNVNPNLDYSITYQTKSEYNKQKLIIGNAGDSDIFLIGAGLYNETNDIVSEFITAVHDDIIILKRSLTINEINDITKAIFNETIIEE